MDLVLVGLSGSGKSSLGRRLAEARGAAFIDLDALIEARAGRSIPAIFAESGEAGFRALEAHEIATLPTPSGRPELERVIAAGGGAVIAPRNRWRLFRDRRAVWLDAPPLELARRLAGSREPRPLLADGDGADRLAALLLQRSRFYAAAERVDASGPAAAALAALEGQLAMGAPEGTRLLDARTSLGRLILGEGIAAAALLEVLAELGVARCTVVSEPVAARHHGERLAARLAAAGIEVATLRLPSGERAKRFSTVEGAARALARGRHERREPIIAVGGGALGDAAGFVAATYLRGVPLIQVPTTLLAQIDSSLGGKTAIDLPEGKNLVGAFHQPAAVVLDTACLESLPRRQIRAALGEAVKMAALGDEALFGLLEAEGPAIARGSRRARASGALAELIERAAWAKVEVVSADERETQDGGRLALNLGHSFAHAIEAAAEYRGILHGEAVAHGLRGALTVGEVLGVTPSRWADRTRRLLACLGLGRERLELDGDAVLGHLGSDKKVAAGRLRWVLATGSGIVVRRDVPEAAVRAGLSAALEGAP